MYKRQVWDRSTGLLQAWRDLMQQTRWLFEIGAANRARGFRPMGWAEFAAAYRREKALTPLYPCLLYTSFCKPAAPDESDAQTHGHHAGALQAVQARAVRAARRRVA